eukprot:9966415-Heterocapsa_arctica.AAC.1
MKLDKSVAAYDEMVESEFGMQNVMLECEHKTLTEEIGADADGGDRHYYAFGRRVRAMSLTSAAESAVASRWETYGRRVLGAESEDGSHDWRKLGENPLARGSAG